MVIEIGAAHSSYFYCSERTLHVSFSCAVMSCHGCDSEWSAGGDAALTGAAAGAKGGTHCKLINCAAYLFSLFRACVISL